MSDQKRQTPISEKEQEQEESIGENASEQDMKMQLSNTKVRTFETSAIEPVIRRDNNIVILAPLPPTFI